MGVKRGANISVTFSEAMKAGTLNSSNVALYKNGTGSAISATATPNAAGTSVTLNPSARLASKTRYMVVL